MWRCSAERQLLATAWRPSTTWRSRSGCCTAIRSPPTSKPLPVRSASASRTASRRGGSACTACCARWELAPATRCCSRCQRTSWSPTRSATRAHARCMWTVVWTPTRWISSRRSGPSRRGRGCCYSNTPSASRPTWMPRSVWRGGTVWRWSRTACMLWVRPTRTDRWVVLGGLPSSAPRRPRPSPPPWAAWW